MPKSPSDSVFKLIKSLSSSEKRYFSLFAQLPIGKSSNKYLQLFIILDKQLKYNERVAMEKLEVDNQKQFSDLKLYLFKLILKSLRNYAGNSSLDLQVKNSIIDAELLQKKGLVSECRKTLSKAMKLSKLADNLTLEHEILKRELKSLVSWVKPIELKQFKEKKLLEIEHCIQRIGIEQKYISLYNEFDQLFRSINFRVDKDQVKPLIDFSNHSMLKEGSAELTFKAELYRLLMNYQSLRFSDRTEESLKWTEKLLSHFEAHPTQLKINQSAYLACVNYHLEELQKSTRWQAYNQFLTRLKNADFAGLDLKSVPIKARLYNLYTYYWIEYLIVNGDFNKVVELEMDIEERLEEYKSHVDQQFLVNIYLNLSIAHFAIGKPQNALEEILKITGQKESKELMNFNLTVRILSAIYHLEAGNQIYVQNLMNNYAYYFRKNKILNAFERDLIHMIEDLSICVYKRQKQNVFRKYLPLFEENSKQINYHYVLGSFNLISYIKAGIKGVEYLETIKSSSSRQY